MLIEEFGSLEKAPPLIEGKPITTFTSVIEKTNRSQFSGLGHLPTGAETVFVLLDLSSVCSPRIMSRFAFRVKMKTPKERKPARSQRVVTSRDYSRLHPVEREKPVDLSDQNEFPELIPGKPVQLKKIPEMAFREEFPALNDSPMKTVKRAVSYGVSEPVRPPPKRAAEEYPTLSGRPEVAVQRPKPATAWNKLKS
jgi:hypothetical protein